MRFLHLADLHLGKMLYGYSLIEDQRYFLKQILDGLEKHRIDAIILAGDIYDRAIPSQEAIDLFDAFVDALINEKHCPIFCISGNHDSASRLNFASRILAKRQLYIQTHLYPTLQPITVQDTDGELDIYLLPFFKRSDLRGLLGVDEHLSMAELFHLYMEKQTIDPQRRSLLVAHGFVQNGASDPAAEVGGVEWMDSHDLAAFGYVALGHLHETHQVKEKIHYGGSPLVYALDEAAQHKALLIVDYQKEAMIEEWTIEPLRKVYSLENHFAYFLKQPPNEDYVFIYLNDEHMYPNAASQIRQIYSHLLGLTYTFSLRPADSALPVREVRSHSTSALFNLFYEELNEVKPSEKQLAIIEKMLGGDH